MNASETRRVLRLVEQGRLTPEEALALWRAFRAAAPTVPQVAPSSEGEEGRRAPAALRPFFPGRTFPWAWALVALGGLALAGAGWLLGVLCLLPLALGGLLALALGWAAWRGVWLVLRLCQPAGEPSRRLRLALPLPLGWVPRRSP